MPRHETPKPAPATVPTTAPTTVTTTPTRAAPTTARAPSAPPTLAPAQAPYRPYQPLTRRRRLLIVARAVATASSVGALLLDPPGSTARVRPGTLSAADAASAPTSGPGGSTDPGAAGATGGPAACGPGQDRGGDGGTPRSIVAPASAAARGRRRRGCATCRLLPR
ncbi:MAG: hypothetical protein ACK5YM_20195 [Pseudomonadota bacterium]